MSVQQNKTGGSGTKAAPYWASGPINKGTYEYYYNPQYTYYNDSNQPFKPTQEQIETGFVHYNGGYYYKTQPSATGIKLIEANMKELETRIAADQKDLDGLREAAKMLNDNPAWSTLLDLHNRGLL